MIRTRIIITATACTLALLAGCSGAGSTHNAAAATKADSTANTAIKPQQRKLFEPIDRAKAASDSMAARANRMNAATDSIMH
ncbi:MAG: hypothetical protein P8099_02160 [Gemmatimonadota bacterium]|jgi:hypothetical protein